MSAPRPRRSSPLRAVRGPRTPRRPLPTAEGGRPGPPGSSATSDAPTRSRVPALALAAAIMVGALLAVLGLNIALSRGSYSAQRLSARAADLSDTEQALAADLQASAAPSVLASRASALGLVAATDPGYLRLDGTVLGSPSPAPTSRPAAAPSAPSATGSPTGSPTTSPVSPSGAAR